MVLGMSLETFTMVHVVISLIAIVTGLLVAWGMLNGTRNEGWVGIFLLTTALTSVTGFLFPISGFTPAIGVGVPGAVLLALAVLGWLVDPVLFWAAYLAAWWFAMGIALGGLANVWIHNLTGGQWGVAVRDSQLAFARAIPLLALLFVPLLLAGGALYPWAANAAEGAARWEGELSAAWFKSAWLSPGFFAARSVACLAIWVVLERVSRAPAYATSRPWSAAALLIYWATASLAAIDWLMSLMPTWYSTAFPALAVTGQMLGGFAAGALAATLRAKGSRRVYRHLGNLLLVYVLCWAYIAYTQYLIIWAEDLPHEIGWYVARFDSGWMAVARVLAIFHFFVPLVVLLWRDAKEAPLVLGTLALGLLFLVWQWIRPAEAPSTPEDEPADQGGGSATAEQ